LLSGCVSSVEPSDALDVFPDTTLYSGVESGAGAKQYQVTISATAGASVTWQSMDPSIASVTGTNTLGTVSALKVGSTTIVATSGGKSVQIPLTIESYSASDRMSAASMYTTTCAASGCHDATGPDVSPSGIGKHSDQQLHDVVISGMNPEGGPVSIGAAAHSFGTAPMPGMIEYMRSLPPGVPHRDD
jgi:hypothetical protein